MDFTLLLYMPKFCLILFALAFFGRLILYLSTNDEREVKLLRNLWNFSLFLLVDPPELRA